MSLGPRIPLFIVASTLGLRNNPTVTGFLLHFPFRRSFYSHLQIKWFLKKNMYLVFSWVHQSIPNHRLGVPSSLLSISVWFFLVSVSLLIWGGWKLPFISRCFSPQFLRSSLSVTTWLSYRMPGQLVRGHFRSRLLQGLCGRWASLTMLSEAFSHAGRPSSYRPSCTLQFLALLTSQPSSTSSADSPAFQTRIKQHAYFIFSNLISAKC